MGKNGTLYFNSCYFFQKPVYELDAVMDDFTEHKPAHKKCYHEQAAQLSARSLYMLAKTVLSLLFNSRLTGILIMLTGAYNFLLSLPKWIELNELSYIYFTD